MRKYTSMCAALTAILAFAPLSEARAGEKVVLAFAVPTGVQYSDILFGRELGFFREEGLDLDIVSFAGGGIVLPQVANKSIQFGSVDPGIVIAAVAKGEPFPVKFAYNYWRTYTNDFAVLADGPIRSLADLKNKTLGVSSMASSVNNVTRPVLKQLGIIWQKDIAVRPVGFGAAAWRQLETGQVDALNFFYSEDVRMRQSGLNIRQIPFPDAYRNVFTQAFAVHNDTIRDRPDLIAKMGRATAKSTVACTAAREACVRAFWKFDPTSRPTPEKEASWIRNSLEIVEANYVAAGNFGGEKPTWGSFPIGGLQAYMEALKDGGAISRSDIPEDQMVTNQFVPEFNKFDGDAVVKRAQAEAALGREGN
ncbi:ABC transporter substrate-binding protein [Bradyrhizobium sp. AUGA SZCCT0042]|uniref:ABC transporter substrate-binding protein n=1 Tax=Bradyrhizobium sp. AUGA SZCCT0042 TaxID=2807651 RepID=UPI001BADA8FE|nr:ABC transporter substrate-binding protein [Bradyrhizobium sp. AUGA SZCCT0042]MBR1297400.1 ABC transporter substrate-binding protein [Bradyrhizobium sp. AUGA SZCCT0042]